MNITYRAADRITQEEAITRAIVAAEIFGEPIELHKDDVEVLVDEDDTVEEILRVFQIGENNIDRIRQWVRDRNLHTADPKVQLGKLLEEAGELASAVLKENETGVVDGIGDCVVVLICLAEQLKLDFDRCINVAYNEIKDRKGKLVNGIFVKEKDL